eukprot:TRINITY_DN22317_c0_g6_i1.p1 TRINITY_DN22317_c0_g6~~TRINITY_DN22317_c0_g6_i1.p1  ORF type:complete len:733 (-),score=143.86 TRINITY_DN22317_c0_g6_i1:260-2458(-)
MLRIIICASCCLWLAQGECKWSDCRNKVSSAVVGCPSGHKQSQKRDCGTGACLFGSCVYASQELLCCPDGDTCAWWDVKCNWNSLKELFYDASDKVKASWDKLTQTVKDKLTTSAAFATLTDLELESLDEDLLAELKSVAGMTGAQLPKIKKILLNMSLIASDHFMKHLGVGTLDDGLANLTAGHVSWSSDVVKSLVNRLQAEDVWGDVKNWTSARVNKIGQAIYRVGTDLLEKLDDEVLSKATNLIEASASQLRQLGVKIQDMAQPFFESLIDNVNLTTLHAAMISNCDFTCANQEDKDFLMDPTLANFGEGLEEYANDVKAKMQRASQEFADNICNGSIGETEAILRAETAACNGSYKGGLLSSFEKWSGSQHAHVVKKMSDSGMLGSFETWAESKLTSMCDAATALTPSSVVKFQAKAIVTLAISAATGGASDVADQVAQVAQVGGGQGGLLIWALGKAAQHTPPETRAAWAKKLKEGFGDVSRWTCQQVASSKEYFAGLDAEDLKALKTEAVKGILPNAITSMTPEQVVGLTADHINELKEASRGRLSGELLSKLDLAQRTAAVCGKNISKCPSSVIDLFMEVAESNFTKLRDKMLEFLVNRTNLARTQIQILSVINASDRPVTENTMSSRRLSGQNASSCTAPGAKGRCSKAAVTFRIQHNDPWKLSSDLSDLRKVAEEFAVQNEVTIGPAKAYTVKRETTIVDSARALYVPVASLIATALALLRFL